MTLRISILLIVFMTQIFTTEAKMNLHEYENVWASALDSGNSLTVKMNRDYLGNHVYEKINL